MLWLHAGWGPGQDTAPAGFFESWLFAGSEDSWWDAGLRSLLLNEAGSDCQGVCTGFFLSGVGFFSFPLHLKGFEAVG